jgi:CRISPR/Cas system-associated exonuclease Cas4 (RecB family)
MAEIDHLSYSQISLYMECPREYYFRYIKYPEKKGDMDSDVFRLGRAYHTAMEGLYSNKPLPQVINEFEAETSSLSSYAAMDIETTKNAILYYQSSIYPQYAGLVQDIEVDVKDFMIPGVEVPIHLRIDLSTVDDRIIDHKTVGYKRPTSKDNKQLLLYAYYHLQKHGRLPRQVEIHSAYKKPKTGELVGVDVSYVEYTDVLRMADLVRNIYFMIKNDIFPCYMASICRSSPYKLEYDNILMRSK